MAYKVKPKDPSIRKVYNPKGREADVLKHVYTRYRQMSDGRENELPSADMDKWQKQWDAYRKPKDADDWRSDIYIPITSSIIEAQLSEIINIDLKPWAVARGSEDEPKAMVMNAIIDYTWDVSKSNVALFQIIKDALIFGTGIGMEYFWKEPRTLKDENGKDIKVLEFNNSYLEPVRLQDFYKDEKGRAFSGPQACRDAIRRYIMDYDDFLTFFSGKEWDPMGNANLVKPGGDTNYYEFYSPPERLQHDREVEVLWYWNKPDDLLAIVANDVLVKFGPNPFKHKQLPFVKTIDIERPYQFYGKGECSLLESLQEEVNTLRRMVVDRNHLDIDKPILVSDTLTLEDEDVMTRPHGIIPVGDVNGAKPLEYSDIPLSVFKSLELLNDDKIRVTGMDERQQSVSAAGTATEAAILKEATLKRLNMKLWHLKNDTLVDIGRLRVANIMQYYSQPTLEKIIGEDMLQRAERDGSLVKMDGESFKKSYRKIRLEDQKLEINKTTNQPSIAPAKGITFFEATPDFFLPTHGGYDIRYKTTSSMPISKPLEQQKADEMYDRLSKNPTVDPWKLAEFELKSRELNPDDFKVQQQGQGGENQVSLQKMVDLAGIENEQMLKGEPIKSTPYASPVHTEAHIAFMQSDRFKKDVSPQNSKKILQIFSDHIGGEMVAQGSRQGAGQLPGGAPGGLPGLPGGGQMPNGAASMGDVVPGRIQGGGEVPSGMAGANSGTQVGRKV